MTTAALLLAAACGTTEDVRLVIRDDTGDLTQEVWDAVDTLSLEAIATDGRCRLRHECPDFVPVRSVDDVAAALRYADVLLELDADEAQVLVLNGRPKHNCFPVQSDGDPPIELNDPVMCAYASLSRGSGEIRLELEGDVDGEDRCPESLDECP
jgi:hypothetical protein